MVERDELLDLREAIDRIKPLRSSEWIVGYLMGAMAAGWGAPETARALRVVAREEEPITRSGAVAP